jgi:septal ring factor EnvC (AmiA/AmiB activator)
MEKKMSKNDKRLDKLNTSIETAAESEKEDILMEMNELRLENTGLKQEVSEAKAPVSKNEDLIAVLEPKIEKLQEQLDRNRLMYIEARDRIKR